MFKKRYGRAQKKIQAQRQIHAVLNNTNAVDTFLGYFKNVL